MEWIQVSTIVVPIVLAVVIGIIYNNRRIDDLRLDMNQRFADINQRFADMNQRFADMNQRFTEMNQRISDLKSDVNEIRRLLIDLVRKDFDIQRVADR